MTRWIGSVFFAFVCGCTACPSGEVTLTFVEQLDDPRCPPVAPIRVPLRDGRLQLEDSVSHPADCGAGCVIRQGGWILEAEAGVSRTVELEGVFDWSSSERETELTVCQIVDEPTSPRCCGLYVTRLSY